MGEKYKIGDISKLLGIPVQTLRYYEEQGIVHPQKDEQTGYRYYDAWDLNNLLDSVHYRSLDFSLQQTQEILNTDSLDEIREKYIKQEKDMLDKVKKYKEKLEVISRQYQQMQLFMSNLGRLSERRSPGLMFYRHRLKDSFQSKEGVQDFKELKVNMGEWIQLIPRATPTFMIPVHSLMNDGRDMQYWWGWSLPIDEALKSNLQVSEDNEYLPAGKSVYTVFEAGEEGTFVDSFYDSVYQKILDEEYTITGNPVGKMIIKTHDEQGYHRYFETWVPVE